MPAYYNEHDEFAAAWLRNLIAAGHVAPGDVDTRSIVDVKPDDLRGYTQCHFFAGIGGWSRALWLAGWPDDRPVWTGSCPCQPFSLAGQQKGFADERHLWPVWRELIAVRRPARIFGEQVASATAWLGLVRGDLEALGYAVGAMPFEAASAGADHLRNRYGLVAHDTRERRGEGRAEHGVRIGRGIAAAGDGGAGNDVAHHHHQGSQGRPFLSERAGQRTIGADGMADAGDMGFADGDGREAGQSAAAAAGYGSAAIATGRGDDMGDAACADEWRSRRQSVACGGPEGPHRGSSAALDWVIGADGKARRVKPGIRLLVDGFPNRVGLLRGFGNAIDPRAFAQFIQAADEAVGDFSMSTAAALAKDQTEIFHYDRERSPGVYITLSEIDGRTRDQALRNAIARQIRKARRYMRNGEGQGTHWTQGYGGRVIEWALSLKEEKGRPIQVASADAEAECDHPVSEVAADSVIAPPSPQAPDLADVLANVDQQITDPVIAELMAAKRARKSWPAGHTISMTNPVVNGDMKTVGTCSCGHVFEYRWGSYEKMDAAIEAHWQKFDCQPDKVDGRGQPINADLPDSADKAVKPVRRKGKAAKEPSANGIASVSEPAAGGHPAAIASAPLDATTAGADASILRALEPAPIGAALSDDDDLAIDWPSYENFLEDKIVTAPLRGIEVDRASLHPWLKPHCMDLVVWALRLGCAAIFANFGLHKTAMQLEWCRQLQKRCGGATLNVVPLGVRHGFVKEAIQLDMDVRFIRTNAEFVALSAEGGVHFLTNYESIREGKLDPNLFGACSLDEASVLRSYGSKTFQEFLPLFAKVPFKLVATATPSPNRYKELIHYSGFLGVMDTGLALTRFFQRNSEKAGDLTLYPHKTEEFWMWIHSWAAFLQRPSELGYSDDGYELPPLKLRWHEVPADHSKAEPERDGQGVMFRAGASSLQESAKSRRDSLSARIEKLGEIIAQDPDSHRIIWHDLEAEREAIEAALPGVVSIMGSMDIDAREEKLHDFEEGRTKWFATKPILSGSGSNFQYHCHKAVYVGMPGDGYKFNDFIQSLYRLQRFGQKHLVEIDIIYSEDMRAGRAALEEKWALDSAMRAKMSEIILAHGLNTLPLRDAMLRTMGVKRVEVTGENFRAINNDSVAECRAWPDNSVDLMVSSIPFGKQYEYSPSYRDFGHSDDNAHFWSQMDFLSSELLRMLKPGRLACIHVKDRILFGAVTGQGVPTVEPFHAEAIMHYRAHGFQYMGMITVVTDVVRENNQTYRLGWSENAKDGTKMGCGMPEYILLLRKPQSDRSRSYADVPVEKSKDIYTRARWQIDAHALWRSSGNRHLTPEEFAQCSSADLAKLFAKTTVDRVYDYEAHVAIGEAVERTGTLPATFMAIAPGSHHPDVWHDINRMRTLNMNQQRKGAEMHLCPLQFDIVDRLIERYSNEGDLVFDPFGGLMTVPYRALLKGRKGAAVELSSPYFIDGVHYLHMAEEKMETPQLFDLATFDAANTPPPTDLAEIEG